MVLRGLRWENFSQKTGPAKKSSTDRNSKPRESWDIKQGPSRLGPSFRRQGSQNCGATNSRENAPQQCCLPAQGRREAHGAAGGRMTHCSENSLFQTSGQAAAQGGPGRDPRSSAHGVWAHHPQILLLGMLSGGLLGPLFPPGSTNQLGSKEAR